MTGWCELVWFGLRHGITAGIGETLMSPLARTAHSLSHISPPTPHPLLSFSHPSFMFCLPLPYHAEPHETDLARSALTLSQISPFLSPLPHRARCQSTKAVSKTTSGLVRVWAASQIRGSFLQCVSACGLPAVCLCHVKGLSLAHPSSAWHARY